LPTIKKQEFNYDFADYVWFKNFLSEEQIQEIKSLWQEDQVVEAKVNQAGQDIDKTELRKSRIIFIKPGTTDWIYEKLAQACIQINTKRYKFDITGFQTELQLAKYEEGGFFDWHMDFGSGDISNRKLSITIQLSDPDEYEGGDLQFMVNQNAVSASREKGTAIIFPSFAMHRVLPVTKGTRMSIVGWIAGPPYK
jgi:PKHD-type hydroxylase